MQCPKCGYEPTLNEMQASPDSCTSCGVIYAKLQGGKQEPEVVEKHRGHSRGLAFWIAFLLLFCAVGFGAKFGYDKYKENEVVSSARPSIKVTTAYLAQQIGYHKSDSSITFGEYFERASNAISEIDKLIINLNGIDSGIARDKIVLASRYMECVRETIRDMSAIMRASMRAESASAAAEDAHKESIETSNEYTAQYASARYLKSLEEKKKELDKILEVELSLTSRVSDLKNLSSEVSAVYGTDSVVAIEQLGRIGK
ncbi:hypothetical protein ACKI1H_29160 [Pseudomonas sp. YH-1]|uniref:hypothetical protein n=1 Tax=Pseudomonas sp. YH-1 TaxID=3384787 RepID=UPI003F7F43A6